jgi:hypothetical protein
MLYRPNGGDVKVVDVPDPPLTADIPSVTYKQLVHTAAYLTSSAKAGLAGQLVLGELKATKPTRLIAALATGASSSALAKALKATPAERVALVAEQVTLGDLTTAKVNNGSLPGMVTPAVKPRVTVAELLAVYCALSPAERVTFGREIGVARVWQPRQHTAVR